MKLFRILFYESVKLLVRLVRWVYYAKRATVNGGKVQHGGPCIIVSNHPGTLMDPLNTVVHMRRRIHFLANASLFKTPFSDWFFTNFYCIKVERYVDTGGRPLNNKNSFRLATEHLTRGGCLYMAPEGGSFEGRQLHKLKTGPARIALNTEQANGFNLGLEILPVGLNYSNPSEFRSELLTIFGEPVKVASFKNDWEADKIGAVRKLTARIRQHLLDVLLATADEEEDKLLAKAEIILQNDNPMPLFEHYQRAKDILREIQNWRKGQPEKYSNLKALTTAYFNKIKKLRVSDEAFVKMQHAGFKQNWPAFILTVVVAFPFFLLGYLSHFLPLMSTHQICRRLYDDPVWAPTFKPLVGIVAYLLFIVLQTWLVYFFSKNTVVAAAYILVFFPAGLAAEWFIKKWKLFLEARRICHLAKRNKKEVEAVVQLRKDILSSYSSVPRAN